MLKRFLKDSYLEQNPPDTAKHFSMKWWKSQSVTVICNFLGDSDVYGKTQENNGLLKQRIKVEIFWVGGCINLDALFNKFY